MTKIHLQAKYEEMLKRERFYVPGITNVAMKDLIKPKPKRSIHPLVKVIIAFTVGLIIGSIL